MLVRAILGCLIFLIGGLYLVGCGGDGVGNGGDGLPPLQAEARATPTTHNFEFPETWVYVAIELPAGYDPANIDPASVRISGWPLTEPDYQQFVDTDTDSIPELQLRLTGFLFIRSLRPPEQSTGDGAMLCQVTGQTATPGGLRDFQAEATVTLSPPPEAHLAWPGPPQDYVQDAGFETQYDSSGAPDKWWYFDADDADDANDWADGGFITPTWDSSESHAGSYSAKVSIAANCPAGPDNGWKQWLWVTGGATRTVTAWVKASGLTAGRAMPGDRVTLEMAFYDKFGNGLGVPAGAWVITPVSDDTDWTQITTSQFTVPANAAVMKIELLLIVNASPQAMTTGVINAWFDDASA